MPPESSSVSSPAVLSTALVVAAGGIFYLQKMASKNSKIIKKPTTPLKVAVIGAGSVGSVIGLALARNPQSEVLLVGRQSLLTTIKKYGERLELQDKSRKAEKESFIALEETSNKKDESLPSVRVTDNLEQVKDFPVLIVATKTTSTKTIANQLAQILPTDSSATILSFQNGVRNATILQQALTNHKSVQISSCMVNFNAVWVPNSNQFAKTTDGGIKMELSSNANDKAHKTRILDLSRALAAEHIPCPLTDGIRPILYSKLLINLFNPINALAGKSTKETLCYKGYRQVWSAAIAEGLAVYKHNNIHPSSFRGLPPVTFTWLGSLPDSVFWFVLGKLVKQDSSARSSMLQDWERGRTETEVDDLAGEIVRLAETADMDAPVNAALVRLVKEAEAAGKGSPCLSSEDLLREVGLEA